jgi:membrane-bound lytic murein transglycosylase A
MLAGRAPIRPGLSPSAHFLALCQRAIHVGPDLTNKQAETFFRIHFQPYFLAARPGHEAFFTAYYRPQTRASLVQNPDFSEPLYSRPSDLVSLSSLSQPIHLSGLASGRLCPGGKLQPYSTRAEINLNGLREAQVLAYVSDPIEAFMIHVQGSASLEIDGQLHDLTYAGRNGHPYVSIGKILGGSGDLGFEEVSLTSLKQWVRAKGQGLGQRGLALLEQNPSFIFFSMSPSTDPTGPTGAAGHALTPLRSIAVDRSLWAYGTPFFVETEIPWISVDKPSPFRRTMIAQDTGSAILGSARADLFFGTGDKAGVLAGNIRHQGRMFVLLPKEQEFE